MKKLIALLLALTMVFGVSVSAMAINSFEAGESSDSSLMPIITSQPRNMRMPVDADSSKLISIKACIPNGDEIGYKLYLGEKLIDDGAYISFNKSYEPGEYRVVVYNKNNPEYSVTSDTFTFRLYKSSPIMEKLSELSAVAFLSSVFVFVPIIGGYLLSPFAALWSAGELLINQIIARIDGSGN